MQSDPTIAVRTTEWVWTVVSNWYGLLARLFWAACREVQIADHMLGFIDDGHAPFSALPELFALISEYGPCRCYRLSVCRFRIGENRPIPIGILAAIADMEKVAGHMSARPFA